MSQPNTVSQSGDADLHSALFAHLVMQQVNMALMFMGRLENPDTGKADTKDLDAAKLFVDMLEMIEAKTRGNRTSQEESLLKQSLMNVRMAFVESVEEKQPSPASSQPTAASPSAADAQPKAETGPAEKAASAAPSEEEHRPKFSKKY